MEKPLSERSIKSLFHACVGARDTEGFLNKDLCDLYPVP